MFAHFKVRSAGTASRRTASISGRFVAPVAALLVALLLDACSAVPPAPVAGSNPADPGARAGSASYRPVTGSYSTLRPVEPLPWREQNDRVAPQDKP